MRIMQRSVVRKIEYITHEVLMYIVVAIPVVVLLYGLAQYR